MRTDWPLHQSAPVPVAPFKQDGTRKDGIGAGHSDRELSKPDVERILAALKTEIREYSLLAATCKFRSHQLASNDFRREVYALEDLYNAIGSGVVFVRVED